AGALLAGQRARAPQRAQPGRLSFRERTSGTRRLRLSEGDRRRRAFEWDRLARRPHPRHAARLRRYDGAPGNCRPAGRVTKDALGEKEEVGPVKITCWKCGRGYDVADGADLRGVSCPSCGNPPTN